MNKKNFYIITRTPLRVSFFGGGTDIPKFYNKNYGEVLSTSINRYIYTSIKSHDDYKTLLPFIRAMKLPIKIATKMKILPRILYLKYAK